MSSDIKSILRCYRDFFKLHISIFVTTLGVSILFLRTNRIVQCSNSYLYIKAAKSFFNVPRKKLSRHCGRGRTISRMLKGPISWPLLLTTAAKQDFAACFRYAKSSFRVRLRKKYFRYIENRINDVIELTSDAILK
jgi:hypothetical protein